MRSLKCPNCSREGVDAQVPRAIIPENKSVTCEMAGAHPNTGWNVEPHSLLSERAARQPQRQDGVRVRGCVRVSNERQVFAEPDESAGKAEIDARERLETQ